jgi:hypothetical protein
MIKKYFTLLNSIDFFSVNELVNNVMCEIKRYQTGSNTLFASDKVEYVAILNKRKKTLILSNFITGEEIKTSFDYEIKPDCLYIHENNVFIGGSFKNELLLQFNFKHNKWYSIEIPDSFKKLGKSIDDFLVINNELLAVDNIVFPKYILFFKLNGDNKCEYLKYFRIPANGTYENIKKAYISDKYIGMFSNTMGISGGASHIAIYSKDNLNKSFTFTFRTGRSFYNLEENNSYKELANFNLISSFIIVNNHLYFACKNNGLAKIEINPKYLKSVDSDSHRMGKAISVNNDIIEFIDKAKNIIDINYLDSDSKIIATFDSEEDEYNHRIIKI